MPEHVTICEVGPRDGLQNEAALVATADKIRLIDLLSTAGITYIEAASFVSPKRVPQMADGAEVLAGIARRPGAIYAALTPNLQGYEAARKAGASEVAVFASASETFSQRNINCSIVESLLRYDAVCAAARDDGIPVRGYVSCVIACPYEGPVKPETVAHVATALLGMGCREISLGDTIGVARPSDVDALLSVVLREIPAAQFAGHFHDTGGRALDCIRTALVHGLRTFDSAIGGTGGCPFAPGSPGNVATEAVLIMLADAGYETGIDRAALQKAADFIGSIVRRQR